ncbi:vomeronasal 2 receptor 635 precursor [Monodelphis domestica]|uniref:G-protein coupled receptors family 3 profile domain-containing protein n=1 Tax=Monodelphis domestica TaxID=13616 RepID=A0A5F8HIB4_MONDO|nr:vomeronasal 2 receptor 635 precursor [Monodelphis domestica]
MLFGKLGMFFSRLFVILIFQVSFSEYQMGEPPCHLKRGYSPTYTKEGDIVIGAFLSLFIQSELKMDKDSFTYSPDRVRINPRFMLKHYQHFLTVQFAVDEINKDPHLLPNVTLGYQFLNNFHQIQLAVESSLIWLSGKGPTIPNYSCDRQHKSVIAIGGMSSKLSMAMARLLGLYKVPQLSYGPFDLVLSDEVLYPYVYQLGSRESTLHLAAVQLMLHFGWTWVGLIISDDLTGEQFFRALKEEMAWNGICLAFTERAPELFQKEHDEFKLLSRILWSSSKVIFIYGNTDSLGEISELLNAYKLHGKMLITTSSWDFSADSKNLIMSNFHGTLMFSYFEREIPGFTDFLSSVHPRANPEDFFQKSFWEVVFDCKLSEISSVDIAHERCEENSSFSQVSHIYLNEIIIGKSFNIYNGVYLFARALHHMLQTETKDVSELVANPLLSWKLHHFLKCVNTINGSKDELCGDGTSMTAETYDIMNYKSFPGRFSVEVKVGEVIPQEKVLSINEEDIDWPEDFPQIPSSTCSVACSPGYRKQSLEGQPICCFDCTLCPDGNISNKTDAEECIQCPEDQYPSKEKDRCLPKIVTYLAYEETLGMILASAALCFSILTTFVLGVFVMHRDTPIVKANNRSLSYILLTSLSLCFLSSLLFIGRPTPANCVLRQTTFAIVFTVAIASILAKTITVVVAFRATKPGSKLRRWLRPAVSYFLIFTCTLIQMCLCGIWLGTYPPFLEMDIYSEVSSIVIQCNEGSLVTFYCVLGYMGFLALVSFTLAFLARNLPDTFNEAKYLTFSMLVFCSVWISFLPAYQSTKGKVMVAMEIFSILVSSAGILTCIFAPKCYVILLCSDRNTLKIMKNKANP